MDRLGNRGMHWFWRAAIAVIMPCLVWFLIWDYAPAVLMPLAKLIRPLTRMVSGDSDRLNIPVLVVLPSVILSIAIYGLLTLCFSRPAAHERETRCRECGYILRGLREPRCPECGEAI